VKSAATYIGIVRPDRPNHFTAIANETMPNAAISDEGNGRYALLSSNLPT